MKIALLDDWQNNALTFAEFERLKPEHQLDVFLDTVDGAVLVERLQPYDIILAMRERTGLQVDILSQLPHLQAVSLVACAMRNRFELLQSQNIMVCGTGSPGHAHQSSHAMLIGMLARDLYTSVHYGIRGMAGVSTGRDFARCNTGILGLGRLGSQVAQLGMAFGMSVPAWSQNLTDRCSEEGGAYAFKR